LGSNTTGSARALPWILSAVFRTSAKRKQSWLGSTSYEALRVKLISNIEHCLTLLQDAFCLTVLHHGRRFGIAFFRGRGERGLEIGDEELDSDQTLLGEESVQMYEHTGAEIALDYREIMHKLRGVDVAPYEEPTDLPNFDESDALEELMRITSLEPQSDSPDC
jgi:hypothetical protein